MNEQNRIKLAEAMGWKLEKPHRHYPIWLHPDGVSAPYKELPFNPYTDANDCEALIQYLVPEYVDYVEVTHGHWESDGTPAASVVAPSVEWRGNDWKHGVCELALKVIDNE